MSGRGKKILYETVSTVCMLAAFAACALIFFYSYKESEESLYSIYALALFTLVTLVFSPFVTVHECGHLFFGACAGLKAVSVRVGYLCITKKKVRLAFSQAAGKTELVPKSGEKVCVRMMAATIGGATFNFIFGVAFAVLFFVLPANPILLFFELFAPLHLYEGIAALLPAELDAGCTDGELFRRLKNDTPEAQVFCNVLTVQGILQKNTFDEVDLKLLYGSPVVREDDPAFLSLLHLRWQYLMWKGELVQAKKELSRLEGLGDYLSDSDLAQVECDMLFTRRVLGEELAQDTVLPIEAQGSCSYLRAELALGKGDKSEYKKIAAAESAAGIKQLESTVFERFIQNF